MNQLGEFATSFSLLVFPAAAGYATRKRMQSENALALAKRIQVANMVVLNPLVLTLGIWVLKIERSVMILPLIGAALSTLMLFVGMAVSKARGATRPQVGSFAFCAAISNIGHTMGGLICLILISEQAFTLSIAYHLYFMFFIYLVCFPLARLFGESHQGSLARSILGAFTDIRSMPMLGIVLGFVLMKSGRERPPEFSTVQVLVVSASTVMVMFGLGLTFQFRRIRDYIKECLAMSVLKFAVTPMLAMGAIWLCGLTGLTARVVTIQSLIPTGIYGFVIATLFDLDVDLANSVFFFTTIFAIVVILPLLAFVVIPS
jgi:predicted permease